MEHYGPVDTGDYPLDYHRHCTICRSTTWSQKLVGCQQHDHGDHASVASANCSDDRAGAALAEESLGGARPSGIARRAGWPVAKSSNWTHLSVGDERARSPCLTHS